MDAFRAALDASPATMVAVSPVIAGQALKGPATEMLRRLAGGSGALDVARLYAGLLDGFVVDTADAAQVPAIEALGMKVLATDIRIPEPADRARLAAETLAFAGRLAAARAGG
jgi:LPPG:FO 2-phospho-L-lactate transferase